MLVQLPLFPELVGPRWLDAHASLAQDGHRVAYKKVSSLRVVAPMCEHIAALTYSLRRFWQSHFTNFSRFFDARGLVWPKEGQGGLEERQQASFVVRMWTEGASPDGDILWRGVVEHIQGGEHQAFQDLGRALRFIEQRTDEGRTRVTERRRR